jgi:hypothetical protein
MTEPYTIKLCPHCQHQLHELLPDDGEGMYDRYHCGGCGRFPLFNEPIIVEVEIKNPCVEIYLEKPPW